MVITLLKIAAGPPRKSNLKIRETNAESMSMEKQKQLPLGQNSPAFI